MTDVVIAQGRRRRREQDDHRTYRKYSGQNTNWLKLILIRRMCTARNYARKNINRAPKQK